MVCADGTTRPNANEPCPWPADTSCDDCWDDYPDDVKERSIRMASSLLWRLSGRQFGCCCITVRPCGDSCIEGVSTYTGWSGVGLSGTGGGNDILRPAIIDGQWVNCGCRVDCCGPDCTVELPVGPVCEVHEVVVDGVVIDPSEYQVLNGRHLQRVGGSCWPECNDWDKDITEPGTWAVTYSWGSPIPADGEYVTGKLASEFAKACVGDKNCQLPRRVQTLTRNGVTATFVEDGNFLNDGLTGIMEVDQWLRSVNPYMLRERSRVYNPQNVGRQKRVTWKAP